MHIITRKRLNDFAQGHPEIRSALEHWYRHMKRNNFASFAELRAIFPTADQIGKLTVFNIGGNRVRLIAAMHYNRHKVYIRAVLTHHIRKYLGGKVFLIIVNKELIFRGLKEGLKIEVPAGRVPFGHPAWGEPAWRFSPNNASGR